MSARAATGTVSMRRSISVFMVCSVTGSDRSMSVLESVAMREADLRRGEDPVAAIKPPGLRRRVVAHPIEIAERRALLLDRHGVGPSRPTPNVIAHRDRQRGAAAVSHQKQRPVDVLSKAALPDIVAGHAVVRMPLERRREGACGHV